MAKVSSTTSKGAGKVLKSKESLDFILGAPLGAMTQKSKNTINNMLPTLSIYPCVGKWSSSNTGGIFQLEDAWKEYSAFLSDVGFNIPRNKIEVAFTPDSLPNESFSNEYGASFLSQMGGVVSDVASDVAQMSGGKTLDEVIDNSAKAWKGSENTTISTLGQGLDTFAGGVRNGLEALNVGDRARAIAGAILGGQRVDMPSVWKGSSHKPTYSITIRLINPYPSNPNMTNKYIVGPIAAILALALPQVGNTVTAGMGKDALADMYSYPFFCKLDSPGLIYSPAAGVENVTIIRGGESGQINYNQTVGEVVIRVDFCNLHNTMIQGGVDFSFRPTLKGYLKSFTDSRSLNIVPFASDEIKGTSSGGDTYKSTTSTAKSINPTTRNTVDDSKIGDAAALSQAEATANAGKPGLSNLELNRSKK